MNRAGSSIQVRYGYDPLTKRVFRAAHARFVLTEDGSLWDVLNDRSADEPQPMRF